MLARTAVDPAALLAAAQNVVPEIDPTVAVYGVETLQDIVAGDLAQFRVTAILVTLSAAWRSCSRPWGCTEDGSAHS